VNIIKKIEEIRTYKCMWCHSIIDSYDKAVECWDDHYSNWSIVHPLEEGQLVIIQMLLPLCKHDYKQGIIRGMTGRYADLIYLIEYSDKSRSWHKWSAVVNGRNAAYSTELAECWKVRAAMARVNKGIK
jgi:hypothetical protein